MLQTPFGAIKVTLDDAPVVCNISTVAPSQQFPNIDEAFLIDWTYDFDGMPHKLACYLDCPSLDGNIESGERLEAISFYIGPGKLTIGCEGDDNHPEDYDYKIEYLSNGMAVCITPTTKSRLFRFGVAWLEECNDTTDIQTWFAADPTLSGS